MSRLMQTPKATSPCMRKNLLGNEQAPDSEVRKHKHENAPCRPCGGSLNPTNRSVNELVLTKGKRNESLLCLSTASSHRPSGKLKTPLLRFPRVRPPPVTLQSPVTDRATARESLVLNI
ncbi:hypothetical protein F2P81_003261 [Scophthalmus maximus]|uniref:Uncharacterized protein n=1 Tax=Scophthalmus maximus TaxID=52904 RepID=A0A6A4TDR1_SCOMX|nr:hypothetical protein F2P81_003261 [Scophthalmus maximus]